MEGPPQPPDIDRRLRLPRLQLIGAAFIALVPLLTFAQVFDERWATGEAVSARLRAQAHYPSRFRSKPSKPITILVENRSAEVLDAVDVVFDPAYIERFAMVTFIPPTRQAYVVSFTAVGPGDVRRVDVLYQGEQFGRHEGRVVVRAGGDSAVVPIHTTVFP